MRRLFRFVRRYILRLLFDISRNDGALASRMEPFGRRSPSRARSGIFLAQSAQSLDKPVRSLLHRLPAFPDQLAQLLFQLRETRRPSIRQRRQDMGEIGMVEEAVQQALAEERLVIVEGSGRLRERADVVLGRAMSGTCLGRPSRL